MTREPRPLHGSKASVAAALALAALTLAGCAGGDPPGQPGDGGISSAVATRGDGPATAPATTQKPTWALGDAWTYDLAGQPTTYVVASETATDWILETDSAERAFADRRDDISRLGPQRKSDLAGSQGADRVEFFRWPLEGGASWQTRWDGLDVRIDVLGGSDDLQELTATPAGAEPGEVLYWYTYDAEARWFGELVRYQPDGSPAVHLRLTQAARGWSGTLARWDLQELARGNGTDGTAAAEPFEVPAGTTDLWARYEFTCTGFAGWGFSVLPANEGAAAQQGYSQGNPCTHAEFEGVVQQAPAAGMWALAVSVGGETASFDYTLLRRILVQVPFP